MPRQERNKSQLSRKARWRAANREKTRAMDREYDASVLGLTRRMVHRHGFSREDAKVLATAVADDMSRCAICGVPNWVVRSLWRRGGPFPPVNTQHRNNNARLHVDHITPGGDSTLDNARLLCPGCNYKRGAAANTDVQVLDFMRWWWQEKFPRRLLWWLNTSPGEGGRLRRSQFCADREQRWEEMNGVPSGEQHRTTTGGDDTRAF